MEPLFPADAPIHRVLGDGTLLLGGGRALLMQLAHPDVAQGVADHSDYASDPFGRLLGTLEASYRILHGTESQARSVTARVARIHDAVAGPGYAANDPELLLWVHATLLDTSFEIHRRFLRPVPADVAEAVYADARRVAELYGCPLDRQPATFAEFRAYVAGMVATLRPSDTSRRLAHDILWGRLPFPSSLALPLVRELSVGLLPDALRRGLDLSWGGSRRRVLRTAQAASRQVLPLVPLTIRMAPGRLLSRAA